MSAAPRTGIIVGGGIGGLCTAIALRQKGIDVRVYEVAPAPRPVGAGIWVAPNAMAVLDRLGIVDAVRQQGAAVARADVVDYRGNALTTMRGADLVRQFGYPIISIHRATLHRVLLDRLDRDRVQFGKECVAIRDEGDGVCVSFGDGTDASGDFLLGADGLNSGVRRQLFPSATLRYSGETCWRGLSRYDLPPQFRDGSLESWAPGRRFGLSQVGGGEVYWWSTLTTAAGGSDATTGVKPRLEELYRDFVSPIPDVIDHTPHDAIVRHDLHDLPPLPRWGTGRIWLLGDAAHAPTPNLGQGGAQAIEDAWVVADCLHTIPDIPTALERYGTRRMPKAHRVVRDSRRFGRLASMRSPLLCTVRNKLVRLTPNAVSKRYLTSLFSLDY